MKKAFLASILIIVSLVVALLFLNQRPRFAGVSLSQNEYHHVTKSRKQVDAMLTDFEGFNHSPKQKLAAIKSDADQIWQSNAKQLGVHDQAKLKEALYGNQGIVSLAENANKGNYRIDSSIASLLDKDFQVVIIKSTSPLNHSSASREKIIDQLNRQLKAESRLYHLANQQ
ncbi:hypothetical protein [Eupransor demetentiae]|uniref:Uncharacterized protein n=1 Tax=Eupransor demetentiae TaxID=3109584 RepID=A0ABM9N3N1_9LACO|nr:hypothetical protein R54876_GBNLAHCA_00322 [Lactobacillaceae bacterium LMG 33000]